MVASDRPAPRLEGPSFGRLDEQRAAALAGGGLDRVALSRRIAEVGPNVQDAGQGTVGAELRPARHGGQRGLDPVPSAEGRPSRMSRSSARAGRQML